MALTEFCFRAGAGGGDCNYINVCTPSYHCDQVVINEPPRAWDQPQNWDQYQDHAQLALMELMREESQKDRVTTSLPMVPQKGFSFKELKNVPPVKLIPIAGEFYKRHAKTGTHPSATITIAPEAVVDHMERTAMAHQITRHYNFGWGNTTMFDALEACSKYMPAWSNLDEQAVAVLIVPDSDNANFSRHVARVSNHLMELQSISSIDDRLAAVYVVYT